MAKALKAPSPFSAALLFEFQAEYLYQWDEPKAAPVERPLPREELAALLRRDLAGEIDSAAVTALFSPGEARTGAELVELVRAAGDLSREELADLATPEAMAALPQLLSTGRLLTLEIPGRPEERIVTGEDLPLWRRALAGDGEAQAELIRRRVSFQGLVPVGDLCQRYPFPEEAVRAAVNGAPFLEVRLRGEVCFTTREALARLRRWTLARRRRALRPRPPAAFQCFLLRNQRRHPEAKAEREEGLREILSILQGVFLPWSLWDSDVLPSWVAGYRREWLAGLLRTGELVWAGRPGPGRELLVAFLFREDLPWLRAAYPPEPPELPRPAERLREALEEKGASFPVELSGELGVPTAEVERALWALLPRPQALGEEEVEKLVRLLLASLECPPPRWNGRCGPWPGRDWRRATTWNRFRPVHRPSGRGSSNPGPGAGDAGPCSPCHKPWGRKR